jgi:hypothetical protein
VQSRGVALGYSVSRRHQHPTRTVWPGSARTVRWCGRSCATRPET